MSRYIQEGAERKPPKPEKKEIPVKAGTKDFDYMELASSKKIPTKSGYK